MTLPTGLASIASQWDDTPHARGALTFCRAQAERREAETRAQAVPDRMIADHAALAVSGAFRSKDTRAIVFRQGGVEVVR